jgi:prepilin-type N-terminal cleavage/methylation domain-containing protein
MTRRPSGFTLIELMLCVAIIGILSSIAIPNFRSVQLRARQAERAIMVKTIETALDDYWVRESRWPTDAGNGVSTLSTAWNPDWPPGTQKRAFRWTPAYGDWNRLSLQIDGNLYYSYYAWAYAGPGYQYRYVYTYGDLDGDGQYNYTYTYRYDWSTTPPQRYRYAYDNVVDSPGVF